MRIFKYIIHELIYWAFLYFALFKKETWGVNVLKFYTVFVFCFSLTCLSPSVRKSIGKKKRVVSSGIDWTVTLIGILALAAAGWFGYAVLKFFTNALFGNLYEEEKKLFKDDKNGKKFNFIFKKNNQSK